MARDSINTILIRGPIHIRQPLDHVLEKLHTLRATLESAKRGILAIKSDFENDLKDDILYYSHLEEKFSNQKLLAEACSGLSSHILEIKNNANLLRFRLLALETTVVNRARRDEFLEEEEEEEERIDIPIPKQKPIEKPVGSTIRRGLSNSSAGSEIKPLNIRKKTKSADSSSSVIMSKPKSKSTDDAIMGKPRSRPKLKPKPKSTDSPILVKRQNSDAAAVKMKLKAEEPLQPGARASQDKKKRKIRRRSYRLTRILFDPID